MAKCFQCHEELTPGMREEGYSSIYKCANCGALNSVRERE